MGIAILTSSNPTWPWSTTGGQTTVTAELLGGGGGGGGVSNNTEEAGGGGRGGSYVRVTLAKGPESTLNITVGALGSAGAAAGGNGGDGGFSEINQNGSVVARAPGGAGGVGGTTNAGHAGGTTENGTEVHTGGVYFAGGDGAAGSIASNFSGGGGGAAGPTSAGTTATTQTGGARGTGTWADGSTTRNTAGADGRTTAAAGQTPADYGGGGSGGYATGATNRAGGAGAAGIVVLTWVDLAPSWRDLGELTSHQTVAPRKLDTRTYEWASAMSLFPTLPAGPAGPSSGGTEGRPSSLPFMQRRVIERTAAPAPVFTTVVDTVVRQWMPAAAALLLCAVPAKAQAADSRYYDQPPSAALLPLAPAGPSIAQTVPTWIDASGRTADHAQTDVRRLDREPETGWIPAVVDGTVRAWIPVFDAERASFRTPAQPHAPITTEPQSGWLAATLPPPASGGGGANAPSGLPFLLRRVIERTTGPQPVYFATLPVAEPPTTEQTAPAWGDRGGLIPARRHAPITTDPSQAWIAVNVPAPSLTVAQQAPAWSQAQSFRTRAARPLDLFRTTSAPDIFGTPAYWTLWTPPFDDGGRTPDRARLDVRRADWAPSSAWITTSLVVTPPTTAQTAPAWIDESGRTPGRGVLDVRTDWAPSFAWVRPVVDVPVRTWAGIWSSELASFRTAARLQAPIPTEPLPALLFVNLPPPVPVAQTVPTWIDESDRTRGRATLDVRAYDWAPSFSLTPAVDIAVARWIPAFDYELGAFRTLARKQEPIVTEPQPAWIFSVLPPPLTPAQIWPALLEAAGISYRTRERARLDVRADYWTPETGWLQPAVDQIVRTWIAVFDAEVSYCTEDGPRLNVRALTDAPELAWLGAVITFPPSVFVTGLHFTGERLAIATVVGVGAERMSGSGFAAESLRPL